MTKDFNLSEETLGYVTSQEVSNTDNRYLVGGSKNVQVDFQKKVKIRSGYFRLGAANSAITNIRNAWTWDSSTGTHLPQRFYDDELEVYLSDVEGYTIDSWTRVSQGWSTTEKLRPALWYDATEKIDLQLMVIGDANIYEWNGAIAVVSSLTGTTITKNGSLTYGQARFYTTRNKTVVCVRTGTEYTYTGGESTATLTGIADTTGLVVGDILVQKIVTQTNKPVANRTNHIIFGHGSENQIAVGSEDDNLVYVSKNTDYTNYSPSTPRVAGEGFTLTLDASCRGINALGKFLIIFCGNHYIHKVEYEQITIGTTLSETVKSPRVDSGLNQGALNHESIVPLGNSLAYLSNEVALRIIQNPEDLIGINPKTFSNPIKPDFDAEDWSNAFGFFYKNILIFTAPTNGHMYMLNFVEDADGKLFRFWNPPQTLPVGPMSIIDSGDGLLLHGHSNSVPESYLLFDGAADGQFTGMDSTDKLPIDAIAIFAYNNYKKRNKLKSFDEYFVEGEITSNTTDLVMDLNYDYGGATQQVEKTIDGSDSDILEGLVSSNSLSQTELATNPMGGLLYPPSNARKFRVEFEIAKEDFFEIAPSFSTNEVDRYWSIISHGANVTLSRRKSINIRK